MKVWRKFTAVALVFIMALAMSATALATPVTTNGSSLGKGGTGNGAVPLGEQGDFNTAIASKTVTLAKEITAYNPSETAITVKAPTISYTYTLGTPTVTDLTVSDNSTSGPVHAGVTTGTSISDSGVVAWSTSDDLSASSAGVANFKTFTVDFSSVNFGEPGVFRYTITEALTTNYSYDSSGVTETSDATSGHTRYLDVYVKAADTYDEEDGGADNWVVYGFTCFYNNESITPSNKATSAVKTTGFVAGTTNGVTAVTADSYYTYNLTVSKTVANDTYGAATYKFPFTVIMSNSVITKDVSIVVSTAKVNGEDNAVATAENFVGTNNLITGTFTDDASNAFQGVLKIMHNTAVTYTGIPCGTDIAVYETNVFTGITYSALTSVDGTARAAAETLTEAEASIITNLTGNTPTVSAQGNSASTGQSTKATFTTTANESQSINHSVAIVNTLVNISPTGVTLRYAPYLLMLGAGVVAMPLSIRRKREDF